MSGISFGLPLNSGRPSSKDVTRFELQGPGPKDIKNMPVSLDGLTRGLGTNGVVGGVYPAKLEDGYFFRRKTVSGPDYGIDATIGGPFRPARGTSFFDYATDAAPASGPVYLYFGALNGTTSGDDNPPFLDYPTNAVPNPNYEPGAYHSEAITGYQGLVDAWVPLRCVQEANLTGYVVGADVTVQKGRLKLAVSGDAIVGAVEDVFSTVKVLIKFNISGVLKIKP